MADRRLQTIFQTAVVCLWLGNWESTSERSQTASLINVRHHRHAMRRKPSYIQLDLRCSLPAPHARCAIFCGDVALQKLSEGRVQEGWIILSGLQNFLHRCFPVAGQNVSADLKDMSRKIKKGLTVGSWSTPCCSVPLVLSQTLVLLETAITTGHRCSC